jgi:hypothetical protein
MGIPAGVPFFLPDPSEIDPMPVTIRTEFETIPESANGPEPAERSDMPNAANEAVFASRVARIEKHARKLDRQRKKRRTRSLGSYMVTPLMLCFFMAGGTVFAWDAMDRPTSSPLEMASILTSKILSY